MAFWDPKNLRPALAYSPAASGRGRAADARGAAAARAAPARPAAPRPPRPAAAPRAAPPTARGTTPRWTLQPGAIQLNEEGTLIIIISR